MKSLHDIPAASPDATEVLDQLFELGDLLGTMLRQDTAEHGLTTARAAVLWALDYAGTMTQAALAHTLDVTPRNITGLLDALQADGLAERRAHPSDRRASMVSLTGAGAETVAALRRGREELARRIFTGMPCDQRDALYAGLHFVLGRLHDIAADDRRR